jgi:hypothetical protein
MNSSARQSLVTAVQRYLSIPAEDAAAVVGELEPFVCRGGDWLFRQGDPADGLFLLARGRLQVWMEPVGVNEGGPRLVAEVEPGETVGYGGTWVAERPAVVATLAAGYADGLPRSLSGRATLWDGDTPCQLVGRVSMDMIAVDVTHLPETPRALDILGPNQGVDALADAAGTIGYELLAALGSRYARRYQERPA